VGAQVHGFVPPATVSRRAGVLLPGKSFQVHSGPRGLAELQAANFLHSG
jgi:predicted deacetylase